nr:MAG: replication initiator protein [Microvirus sp.]
MVCYHPITAWRSLDGRGANGKWPLVFNKRDGYCDLEVQVPCGQCIGCRLERSRQWAVRCVHEASLYPRNCFITLTYDDAHLPGISLVPRDYVLFMKRLRKRFGSGIRFFHCGEYGSLNLRPHHHAILFNFDFEDKELWSVRSGVRLYRSAALESLWPYGFSTIGDVTFESAAYVARYVLKKVTGPDAQAHYAGRVPEYVTMSRKPGIAYDWFRRYYTDVYPHDYVVIRDGIKCRPPRYYDNLYDNITNSCVVSNAKLKPLHVLKFYRRLKARKHFIDNTYRRLRVREACQYDKLDKLVRKL